MITGQSRTPSEVSRTTLSFALLGGSVAWLLHLLLVYVIGEFGCEAGWHHYLWIGVPVTTWLLIVVSVATLALAGAAAWASIYKERLLAPEERDDAHSVSSAFFVARAGQITNWLFVFVIAMQSIPIIYFWRRC